MWTANAFNLDESMFLYFCEVLSQTHFYQDDVLFNSWNELLNGGGGRYNGRTPIYSFNGENVKESSKW